MSNSLAFRRGVHCAAAFVVSLPVAGALAAPPSELSPYMVEGTTAQAIWWREDGKERYAVRSRPDSEWVERDANTQLQLQVGAFDPTRSLPGLPMWALSSTGPRRQIAQFRTQTLPEYRDALAAIGVQVEAPLPDQALIVRADGDALARLRALPFVRWVGAYEPGYRIEPELLQQLIADSNAPTAAAADPIPVSIMVFGRGFAAKAGVVMHLQALGAQVDSATPNSFIVEATVTPAQLKGLMDHDDVLYIDRRLPIVEYMDNVRIVGGANYVQSVAGYDGTGVRGEVMDSNLFETHADFQALPAIFHGGRGGSSSHGTSVYGIVFGTGTSNPAGRGMLPAAQGIFADFGNLTDRYVHTGQLLAPPYEAVFQTNSWGSCCTTAYTTQAAAIDDNLFDHDILLLQAQANSGSTSSDVIAFAKNLVSVGGIRHFNNTNLADDSWTNAGSIGPAADGRIKPDLSFWYESIFTTSNSGGYTTGFGGTSAATPMTAGHFGLFFQMWNDGIFGNTVDAAGTVFSNRPHATLAKAMMINTAAPYPFSGAAADLRRMTQGWGRPNVQQLYDRRGEIFVVDETDVLSNLESTSYSLEVEPGQPYFRATLVYLDPAGVPAAARARINDLSLRVQSPSGLVYWGNNGLAAGNVSTAGGVANVIDTVENVWLENPEAGAWAIEVRADQIVQDAHVETPQIDADYALVVSGIVPPSTALLGDMNCDGLVTLGDIAGFVLALTDPLGYAATYPSCSLLNADFSGDGFVTVGDISGFVALLTGN